MALGLLIKHREDFDCHTQKGLKFISVLVSILCVDFEKKNKKKGGEAPNPISQELATAPALSKWYSGPNFNCDGASRSNR